MKDRMCQSMDSPKRRATGEAFIRRRSIFLLCIPVVGWLILGIQFVLRQHSRPCEESLVYSHKVPVVPIRIRKYIAGQSAGDVLQTLSMPDTVSPRTTASCTTVPDSITRGTVVPCAVHYIEGLSDFYRKFFETTINRSYKGMIHTLDRPLQLISLLVVHGEGVHQQERYLRLLVSNESPERFNYCEWSIDRLYMENDRRACMWAEPLRFYHEIPPWSLSALSWDIPLPAGTVDMELRLKIAMFASSCKTIGENSGKTVVYDASAKTVCQLPPQRLTDVYPQAFIDQYLIKHGNEPYPLYVYEEQADGGIQFSHCPFCGHFNLTSFDECRCCHTLKETQRLFQTQVLDAAYRDF